MSEEKNIQNNIADAQSEFMSNFVRKGKRKNCIFVPKSSSNYQIITNKISQYMQTNNKLQKDEEHIQNKSNPEE